jgi:hypothetical protein
MGVRALQGIIKKEKRQSAECEKISETHVTDKGPVSRMSDKLLELNHKKINNAIT